MKREKSHPRGFPRNAEAGDLFEDFLIAAIASVLTIRLFLSLAGYPAVTTGVLHIAHMLWGGLLMLGALVLLLAFLGKGRARLAAVVGGIGFGTFIDEIGKFITRDNDYFYRPAVAIIYVIFVLLWVGLRALRGGAGFSSLEYLMNALREVEEVAREDLDTAERDRALAYLAQADPDHPLVEPLRRVLEETPAAGARSPGRLKRIRNRLRDLYRRLAAMRGFAFAVVTFFALRLAFQLIQAVLLIFFGESAPMQLLRLGLPLLPLRRAVHLNLLGGVEVAAIAAATGLILVGMLRIRRSRLEAYRMFQRSVLVSILLVQVFVFYREQWAALIELALNIVLLIALRFMIARESSAPPHGKASGS